MHKLKHSTTRLKKKETICQNEGQGIPFVGAAILNRVLVYLLYPFPGDTPGSRWPIPTLSSIPEWEGLWAPCTTAKPRLSAAQNTISEVCLLCFFRLIATGLNYVRPAKEWVKTSPPRRERQKTGLLACDNQVWGFQGKTSLTAGETEDSSRLSETGSKLDRGQEQQVFSSVSGSCWYFWFPSMEINVTLNLDFTWE